MNVIITGGSKGIGKAIAEKFAAEGARLILTSRNMDKLNETKAAINLNYPATTIDVYATDLSVKENVRLLANYCLEKFTPDILVNNAGVYTPGNCFDEEDLAMEKIMNINFFSAYHLTRFLLPSMIKNSSGHIFNISSVAGLKPYKGGGSYSVSKFALNGFSQNLRMELMQYGIKVTSIFSGPVLTDSWAGFDNSQQRIMEPSDIAEMVLSATRLSKQAVVDDIVIRPQLGEL
jgi:short-subunit dehydrogenase